MSDGTGMVPPPNNTPSGAVTSNEATRKNPRQGMKSGIKVDTNRHGIRRETPIGQQQQKRTGRKKV
jgi:hypothetical protein